MAVKNWTTSLREKVVYISPDGLIYNFHDPSGKALITMSNWGLPAAEIADARGPFQHGTNPLTIRMPPRRVPMEITHTGCSREEYWSNRIDLVNALRLNRTNVNNPTPGSLRWYRANGQIRQLDVFVVRGPEFPLGKDRWNEFSYQETLEFLAHNPIIYDPALKTSTFIDLGCTITDHLVFPFSFGQVDVLFGISTCNATNIRTVNYLGNWQEFPLITVTGPAKNFKITHTQTGLFIRFSDYTIPSGDSAIFDLRYGRKTVKLGSTGASLLGRISTDSDLGTFAIEPHPVVTNGVNTFEVSIDEGDGNTRVQFDYHDRFVGL